MLQMGSICFSNATPAMLRAKVDGEKMLRESTQQWPGCGVNAGGRMKYLCGRPRECGKTFDKVLYPRTPHHRRRHHHPSPFPLRLATGVTIFFAWFSEPTAVRPLALSSLRVLLKTRNSRQLTRHCL